MDVNALQQLPLFKNCSEKSLQSLLDSPYMTRKFRNGEIILSVGDTVDSLMILTSGHVVTRMGSEEGREIVVEKISSPSIVAQAFLFDSDRRIQVEIRAVGNTELLYLNRQAFLALIQCQPDILDSFLKTVADRCRFLTKKLKTFAVMGLRNRILEYLRENQIISNIVKTAEEMGVVRQSLSRILQEMVSEGLVIKSINGYSLP